VRIYGLSIRGQSRRGGTPSWELGEVLTTPHTKTYGVTTRIFFTAELRAKKSDLWLAYVAVLLWEDELSRLMIVFKRL
jgi:hypothetical protein